MYLESTCGAVFSLYEVHFGTSTLILAVHVLSLRSGLFVLIVTYSESHFASMTRAPIISWHTNTVHMHTGDWVLGRNAQMLLHWVMSAVRWKFTFPCGQEQLKHYPPLIAPQIDSVHHFCCALMDKWMKRSTRYGPTSVHLVFHFLNGVFLFHI